jgi:16S rRNA (guanine1516-N2)-methyltransferase
VLFCLCDVFGDAKLLHLPLTVTWETQVQKETASILAKRLNLSVYSIEEFKNLALDSAQLQVTAERIQLVTQDEQGEHSLFVQFDSGPLFYRIKKGVGKNEDLSRACGLKSIKGKVHILDVTAGLGRDAFVLASLGAVVHLVERSAIMITLLEDGLARAKKNIEIASIVNENMHLSLGEALSVLEHLEKVEYPDVIYIDPMFDRNAKKALNKIEMRTIRAIVGEDLDAERVLQSALTRARKRVVVKRMRQAETLQGPSPNFMVKGKSCRYDIYLTDPKP